MICDWNTLRFCFGRRLLYAVAGSRFDRITIYGIVQIPPRELHRPFHDAASRYVITTGTPPGVGLGRKPPLYLKPGDVMTLSVSGLGEQHQEVRAFSEGFWNSYPSA